MKTLIIYATKHGFAEKCIKLLKDKKIKRTIPRLV